MSSRPIERMVRTRLPTAHGTFEAYGYRVRDRRRVAGDSEEHIALTFGDLDLPDRDPRAGLLVRVHSECLTGEAFGSLRCDCGPQLDTALRMIASEEAGVLVYLRGQEGRGIGLLPKLAAYALQDEGADTVDANLALGWPADLRDYSSAAFILADLGVRRIRLLTNNPDKIAALRANGVQVTGREPLVTPADPESAVYLRTKRERLGHLLPEIGTPR